MLATSESVKKGGQSKEAFKAERAIFWSWQSLPFLPGIYRPRFFLTLPTFILTIFSLWKDAFIYPEVLLPFAVLWLPEKNSAVHQLKEWKKGFCLENQKENAVTSQKVFQCILSFLRSNLGDFSLATQCLKKRLIWTFCLHMRLHYFFVIVLLLLVSHSFPGREKIYTDQLFWCIFSF